jgi:hypothetical protein
MEESIRPDASTNAKLTNVKTKKSNAKRKRAANPFVVEDSAGSCVDIFIVCNLFPHLVSVNFYQKAIGLPSPNGDITSIT